MHRIYQNLGLVGMLALAVTLSCPAQTAKPVITRIDPPNWFTQLPDSMLLVHGEHFEQTKFSLKASNGTRLLKQSVSLNGHWAFLTVATEKARAGTLQVIATNRLGSTSTPFAITARRSIAQQPQGFSSKDVMYLIMPDRFADGDLANDKLASFRPPDDRTAGRAYHGGDLKGIENHLDYLQQLGVTTVWTTPLYDNSAEQNPTTYHGYSATDMYGVDPHFGSMADLQALVAALHARGMKFVLDTVPNHVGPGIPWAHDQPTANWLHGTPESHLECKGEFSLITDTHSDPAARRVLEDGWFANILPDLNQDNPYVAQYLVQNAIWWIEMAGLDGLRIDTFPYVPRSFWHGYNQQLHALYPGLTDVGEVFNKDAKITSFFAGGRANTGADGTWDTGLDTPFDFPVYFALRSTLTHRQPMSALGDVLAQDSLYPHPERLVTFFANHDVKRFLSEPGATPASLHLAYGLLATLRGMPEIYFGDEIGMTGGDDPDNRRDFPGGFPQDKTDAFTAAGRDAEQARMHDWAAHLFTMRAATPALREGAQQTLLSDSSTLAFMRFLPADATPCSGSPVVIIVNNDAAPHDVSVDAAQLRGCSQFHPLLANGAPAEVSSGSLHVKLPGQEIAIFQATP